MPAPPSAFWFDRPAGHWLEALPVGNGHTGAMCFGIPGSDRIQINDETAWSGSPRSEAAGGLVSSETAREALADARSALAHEDHGAAERDLRRLQQRYTQAYLPFVDLGLSVQVGGREIRPEAVTGYRRWLDMGRGLAVHEYVVDGHRVTQTIFVSRPADVLVVDVVSDHPDGVHLAHTLTTPLRGLGTAAGGTVSGILLRLPSDVAPTHEGVDVPVAYSEDTGASLRGAAAVTVRERPGGVALFLSTATTFKAIGAQPEGTERNCFERAASRVEAASDRDIAEIRAEHVAGHADLYDRVELTLAGKVSDAEGGSGECVPVDQLLRAPDSWRAAPELVSLLFQYGRYLLISSSRPGGLPANLQGIWNDQLQPPWSSNYTLNINTEMNYWPAGVTALPECVEP
ncbi:glycosyl hydrolase family 95 catalytic domain-containing protein, partial [Phytoactinopolyspora endophytica]|uniref:glycosyl hydrolase family 95 catalytic domain-containing protein n=1 Tax=Phytoactinopolyspora endophytica TaxID=1642495 RepID=UPI00197BBB42